MPKSKFGFSKSMTHPIVDSGVRSGICEQKIWPCIHDVFCHNHVLLSALDHFLEFNDKLWSQKTGQNISYFYLIQDWIALGSKPIDLLFLYNSSFYSCLR